jgi:hypothetical protein
VTVDPSLEDPRPLEGPAASDAVTVAFGDLEADVFGIARVGRSAGDGGTVASGLGLLFVGGELAEVRAQGGEPAGASWDTVSAGGVRTSVEEPLARWTIAFDGEDGTLGFDLALRAVSAPAVTDPKSDAAKLGGMQGYEQLVAVEGTVRGGGAPRKVRCLGQRGHSWGAPDWDKLTLARTIGLWLEGDVGGTLTALRPAKASDHGHEQAAGALFLPGAEDGPTEAVPIAEPRISTTYDADGRQVAAGLELYLGGDDEVAHRAAGEVVCGTTLDLGRLRLDTAFLRWRMEGREGVGRYDLLRRTDA